MEKEKKVSAKKTTKKEPIKKEENKKTVKKSAPRKKELNLTTNLKKEENEIKIKLKGENEIECAFCHKYFDKGLKICPYCRKHQKYGLGITFTIIVIAVFLTVILASSLIEKFAINGKTEEEYKQSCVLTTYEQLIRTPKEYKGKDIKVIGEVVEVIGYDDGFSNNMTIKINANLFEGKEQFISLEFIDKEYEQGFIAGDIITAYGEYTQINGNEPTIEIKYITLGEL